MKYSKERTEKYYNLMLANRLYKYFLEIAKRLEEE